MIHRLNEQEQTRERVHAEPQGERTGNRHT